MQKLTWQMPFPPTSLVQMVAAPTVPHFDMQSESDSAARVTCKNNIISLSQIYAIKSFLQMNLLKKSRL